MAHADHVGGRRAVRRRASLPRNRVPPRRAASRFSQPALRFVAGGAVILALIGLAAGALGFLEAFGVQSQADALGRKVSALEQRLGLDEAKAANEQRRVSSISTQAVSAGRQTSHVASQLTDVAVQMQGFQDELAGYSSCLPQLQSEITGLVITWHIGRFKASPSYVTLLDKAHPKGACR